MELHFWRLVPNQNGIGQFATLQILGSYEYSDDKHEDLGILSLNITNLLSQNTVTIVEAKVWSR
jgi:hypothetical protein